MLHETRKTPYTTFLIGCYSGSFVKALVPIPGGGFSCPCLMLNISWAGNIIEVELHK